MDRYINLRIIASLERIRRKQVDWLGEKLAATPVWDIIYALYRARSETSLDLLARDMGMTPEMVQRWLSILEREAMVEGSSPRCYRLTGKGTDAVEDVLSVAYGSPEHELAC